MSEMCYMLDVAPRNPELLFRSSLLHFFPPGSSIYHVGMNVRVCLSVFLFTSDKLEGGCVCVRVQVCVYTK